MKRWIGRFIRQGASGFDRARTLANSRKSAKALRAAYCKKNGSVLSPRLTKSIKTYAENRLGDKRYWHWLALYTEVRGTFIEGWIPDDYYRFTLLQEWNPPEYANLSSMKTFDHRLLPGSTITPIVTKLSGIYYDRFMKRVDENSAAGLVHNHGGEIVIKRDRAASGKGIKFLPATEFKPGLLTNENNYLIQPSVQQHPALKALHPESVNTIRVTTFLDGSGNVTVKHRSVRVGVNSERIVNSGDCFFFLDAGGKAMTAAYGDDGFSKGELHPDTGYPFREFHLSCMDEAEKLCISSHLKYPYVRFIGWDLYINEDEKPVLIEWNTRPDIWVNEAIAGPLWPEGWD